MPWDLPDKWRDEDYWPQEEYVEKETNPEVLVSLQKDWFFAIIDEKKQRS